MKNNKIIHSVEQSDAISKLKELYKECADKIGQLEKDEKLDLLPYFREFAEIFLPDSYREHFKTEKVWRELESSYKKTCGSSPFVFKKDDELNLVGNVKRFKNAINENLYNNKNMWDDISLDVLGKPHYTVFISGVALQVPQRKNQRIEIGTIRELYITCANELRQLENKQAFNFLPYFRQYAEQNLPETFREHFQTDEQWHRLERMYRETYGSSPFVFVKGLLNGELSRQLERFKDLIGNNLYNIRMIGRFGDYNRATGNGIPRAVLGRENYFIFLESVNTYL